MKRTNMNKISEETLKLWYEVNKKYGNHVYTLGINGKNEVVLDKGYTEFLAKGNEDVQKVLRDLLKD